jgi:hypothetical protein
MRLIYSAGAAGQSAVDRVRRAARRFVTEFTFPYRASLLK